MPSADRAKWRKALPSPPAIQAGLSRTLRSSPRLSRALWRPPGSPRVCRALRGSVTLALWRSR
eukprot:8892564-Alexandrium_andersonii.AAC.1